MKKLVLSFVTFLNLASYTNASDQETLKTHNIPELKTYCEKYKPTTEHAKGVCRHVLSEGKEEKGWGDRLDAVAVLGQEINQSSYSNAEKKERATELLKIANKVLHPNTRTSHPGIFKDLETLAK